MVPVVTASPLLGQARAATTRLGSAGALFGLLYYLLIGAAMALVGAALLAPTLIVWPAGLLAAAGGGAT